MNNLVNEISLKLGNPLTEFENAIYHECRLFVHKKGWNEFQAEEVYPDRNNQHNTRRQAVRRLVNKGYIEYHPSAYKNDKPVFMVYMVPGMKGLPKEKPEWIKRLHDNYPPF